MMIDCVVPARALLGESPVWSVEEARLYWVDIEGMRIHRYDPTTGVDESMSIDSRPGSIALTSTPGRLLVASEGDLGFVSWGRPEIEILHTLEPSGTGNRLNDGRATPEGGMVVGSMYEDTRARRFTGQLHRVAPDGSHVVLRDTIGVSNGQAFSVDGTRYYFADSFHGLVWQFDWRDETPSNEQVFVDFDGVLPGAPDGACVDEDGCYWVACVNGWAVARLTPDGAVDHVVDLPIKRPTMPAFGGPDLRTLFITSIGDAERTDPDEIEPGGVFAFDAGVAGLPEPPFAG